MADVLKKFGRYFLLDHIAQGGMAEIFRARLASVDGAGRLLVIKRIQAGYGSNLEFLQMFRSEIKVTMGFNHPNIAQLYDFGEEVGQPYIAMEFIDGRNVRQFLSKLNQQKKPFPVEYAAYIIEQAACGLHYAHSFMDKISGQALNIVHRDISPQNILLSYDGTIKVIDFGIAKATTNLENTRAGVIKGKPSYLSPEQITGDVLDGRCDLFALGIVFWELLTGKKLFSGESDLAVLKQIESCQNVKPPSSLNPDVPRELDLIVMRALARSADKRFQTGEEFQRAIRKFLAAYAPDFGPSDLSQFAKELFQEDIIEDRKHIQRLNDRVEQLLIATGSISRPTAVPGGPNSGEILVEPEEGTTTAVRGLTLVQPTNPAEAFSNREYVATTDLKKEKVELDYVNRASSEARASLMVAPVSSQTRASISAFTGSNASRPRPTGKTGITEYTNSALQHQQKAEATSGGRFKLLLALVAIGAGAYFGPGALREVMHPTVPENKGVPVAVIPKPTGAAGVERQPASTIQLKLNVNPGGEGTQISVNGNAVDNATGTLEVPMDEPLEVNIQRAGYLPLRREFVINSRDVGTRRLWPMDIALEATRSGFLTIHTTPSAEATVMVEGKPWIRKTPFENEKLPAGEYRVKLANDLLGMEKTITVRVEEGKVTNIPDERLEIRN